MIVPNKQQNPDPLDDARRRATFTMKARVILVKIFGADPIPGLEKKERKEEKIEAAHFAEAKDRGLNPFAYRDKNTDTGWQFCRHHNVRTTGVLDQLSVGYKFVGGHLQEVEGKRRPVATLNFSIEGEAKELPAEAVEILNTQRFGQLTLWVNSRTDQETGRAFRLDSLNLTQPHTPSKRKLERGTSELKVVGNTYRLEQIPDIPPLES